MSSPTSLATTAFTILSTLWSGLVVCVIAAIVALNLAGFEIDVVATGSMEPAIATNSLAVTKPAVPSSVEVGDVILFQNHNDQRVMHRVVEVIEHRGSYRYRTMGDANEQPDSQLVHEASVLGSFEASIPRIGGFADGSPESLLMLFAAQLPIMWLAFQRRAPAQQVALEQLAIPGWLANG